MNRSLSRLIALAFVCLTLPALARAAEAYKVDPVHSSAVFRVKHANTAWFWGRFSDPTGKFSLDESDPAKSSFEVELQVAKIDTGNEKRDAHLHSPDFFDMKKYPSISFKSTSVKKGEGDALEVTGELTFLGQTKPVTASVELTGKGEFPPGTHRAGVEATVMVKMSDFGIKPGALGDEVKVIVALEGTKE